MSSKKTEMTPMDVGCPRLIPLGNLNPNSAGSYGSMMKAFSDAQSSPTMFKTSASMCPNFNVGYSNPAFGGNWQTFSNVTGIKKK